MAGRIRAEDIELVRERAAIDDVVKDYVSLKPAGGGSLKGLCPFHDERSPSFQVTPSRGFYYCFGCGEGGDVLTFVQKMEHASFVEAVEKLAGKYVSALGVDGLESVLLYHVVPGAKINANAAMQADGAKLETALGQKITVNVTKQGIFLKDGAKDVSDPKVIVTNINRGNKQIAHAINRVLLPAA